MAATPMADKIEIVSFPLQKIDEALLLFTPRPSVDNEMAMTYSMTIRNEEILLVDGKFIPVNLRLSNATV